MPGSLRSVTRFGPNKYLVEEMTIAIVPVPRMIVSMLARKPPGEGLPSLLAVGDVNFNGVPAGEKTSDGIFHETRSGGVQMWKPLPGARQEVEAVAKLFRTEKPGGAFRLLMGDQAVEASSAARW